MLIFYFMLFTSSTLEIFTELHYSIAEGVILQCILHNCRHSSSTFEQAMYYLLVPPSTSYSPSCTATDAGLSAPSRHWRNGVTAVSFQMAKQVKM